MKIIFRTDASARIGSGHQMRCLTLADALRARGVECHFITREHEGNMIPVIREWGFGVSILHHQAPCYRLPLLGGDPAHSDWLGVSWQVDAHQTLSALEEKKKVDWVIVDHYAIDKRWEKAVRSHCKRMMVIDDLADREHDCDLLVDPGGDPQLSEIYKKLTPAGCDLFVGLHYAILRPEFDVARASLDKRQTKVLPHHLVVLFGGEDQFSNTLAVMQTIQEISPSKTEVDVIVPTANRDKIAIAEMCRKYKGFHMHLATNRVAALFAQADLAVGSGGSATYERLYLRLPSILKPVAENQRVPLECLARMGLVDTYADQNDLKEKLGRAFSQGVMIPRDVVRNGITAICGALLDPYILLKHPTAFDLRRTFLWLKDKALRRQFLMSTRPERRQHFQYWRALLHPGSKHIFSIHYKNSHVGNAGIKNIDHEASQAELWLYFGVPELRGRGLGAVILNQLECYIRSNLNCRKAVLHVSRDNQAACRLYSKGGYVVSPLNDSSDADFCADLDVMRMEKLL